MPYIDYENLLTVIKGKWNEAAKIIFILIGGFLLIRLVRSLADRLLELIKDDDPLTTHERELRAITLAGIFKGVAKIVIVIISGLMILKVCGIDTSPLIAGVGVAGLAISFGAQNLIRDFISGFFILLENQFKVGDVIRAAGVSGMVEDMNLRVTVLRDLEGVAHFIPNGEIKVVSNLAKQWSRAVVNVGVAYKDVVLHKCLLTKVCFCSFPDEPGTSAGVVLFFHLGRQSKQVRLLSASRPKSSVNFHNLSLRDACQLSGSP